jgi:hypothetical protein
MTETMTRRLDRRECVHGALSGALLAAGAAAVLAARSTRRPGSRFASPLPTLPAGRVGFSHGTGAYAPSEHALA